LDHIQRARFGDDLSHVLVATGLTELQWNEVIRGRRELSWQQLMDFGILTDTDPVTLHMGAFSLNYPMILEGAKAKIGRHFMKLASRVHLALGSDIRELDFDALEHVFLAAAADQLDHSIQNLETSKLA
ncbi:MAG: hypothetical protein AAF862_16235, partial [Pseudomonadota bacterium]